MSEMSIAYLADLKPAGADVAAKAVYVATFARQHLGHEVNMFTEKAWRALKDEATNPGRESRALRCTECNAVATLDEWMLMLSSCCGQWERYCEGLSPLHDERLALVTKRCSHQATALGIRILTNLLEG